MHGLRLRHLVGITIPMIVGCSGGTESEIVGRWIADVRSEVLEFHSGGTVTLSKSGSSLSGDYRFLDESTVRMELTFLGGSIVSVHRMAREGDSLLLCNETQECVRYERDSQP